MIPTPIVLVLIYNQLKIIPGQKSTPRGQEDSEGEYEESMRHRLSPKMRHIKDVAEGLA